MSAMRVALGIVLACGACDFQPDAQLGYIIEEIIQRDVEIVVFLHTTIEVNPHVK
jgi:hypothetical protein